jgi:hypothetical protein
MLKDKALSVIKINNRTYSIRATIHAIERMAERNIDEYTVVGNILLLGEETITNLQRTNSEAIIIDNDKNVSIVIAFCKNKIKVVTVINKSNVFVKQGTTIRRLN